MLNAKLYNESKMISEVKEKNKELWYRISSLNSTLTDRIEKYCGSEIIEYFLHMLYSVHLYLEAKGGNTADIMQEYLKTILTYFSEGRTHDYHRVNTVTMKLEGGDDRPLVFSNYAYSLRYSHIFDDAFEFDRRMLFGISIISQFPDILDEMISEWKKF